MLMPIYISDYCFFLPINEGKEDIMKNIKKILCIALVLLMLVGIVACGTEDPAETPDGSDPAQGDVSESVSETEKETDEWGQEVIKDGIPEELDYNGAEVHILIRSGEQYRREWQAETNTDSLDQEVYRRNVDVEEFLGVKLDFIPCDEGDKFATFRDKVVNVAKSGQGGVDIVSAYAAYGTNPLLLANYYDLNNSAFTYLDLDKAYWNQNYISVAENYGRLFTVVGDNNLSVFDRAMVVYFNQTMAEEKGITGLYDTVLDGGWTYEVMYNMVKDICETDGSTDASKYTYGMTTIKGSEATDGFLYSFNLSLTKTNEDGTHEMVTDSAREKLVNGYAKVLEIGYSTGTYLHEGSMDNYKMFTEGRALFNLDVIYHYASGNTMMKNMTDTYGMLPVPKYDGDQDTYYTGVQDAYNITSVLYHPKQNYEMVSAVLEYMASTGYSRLRPYYFEKMVKGQYLQDSESGRVFDLVLAGTRFDFADVYAESAGTIRNKMWRAPFQANAQIASYLNENSIQTYNAALAEMDEWLATHY